MEPDDEPGAFGCGIRAQHLAPGRRPEICRQRSHTAKSRRPAPPLPGVLGRARVSRLYRRAGVQPVLAFRERQPFLDARSGGARVLAAVGGGWAVFEVESLALDDCFWVAVAARLFDLDRFSEAPELPDPP